MKKYFNIPDQDNKKQIADTHYYNWLKGQNLSDVHLINTKLDYLKSLGFSKGEDWLSDTDLFTLKAIEGYYFFKEIEPNLKTLN